MKRVIGLLLGLYCMFSVQLNAQTPDQPLFWVNDVPVMVSEFNYIYQKNNGKNANYTKKSLEEYMDLYVKFKLKVAKAKEMKLDTIPSLIKELRGYRRQLARSYLTDKEVTNHLTKELYDRMQSDIDVSHILIQVKKDASPSDTLRAFMQAQSLRNMINQGQSFDDLARKFSSDKHSANKGGRIGYVSAKLPDGFYQLETAIYNTPVGEIAGPVRTNVGYHIVKVHDKRPARGWIEAAHILVRNAKKGVPDAKAMKKINVIYQQLLAGASFEDMAAQFSEDKTTNKKGGKIGRFGINKFEASFEDAAFSLANDGDFSKPIETQIGWHIIKRLKKKSLGSYDREKRKLQNKISTDSRFEIAQNALIARIKTESNFHIDSAAFNAFADSLDATLFSYKWKAPKNLSDEPIVFIGDKTFDAIDLSNNFKRNTKTRLSLDANTPVSEGLEKLMDDFIKEKAIDYEEANLENKYPDFKSLMREYEEGILLFEATKINVWDKASHDSLGLAKFYSEHKMNYMHEPRAEVVTVNMHGVSKKVADKIHSRAMNKVLDKALSKSYVKKMESLDRFKSLQTQNTIDKVGAMSFREGAVSPLIYNEKDLMASFQKITRIMPRTPKTLAEARGYIIADYQDQLEREWVDSLRQQYDIRIDKKVLEGLAKN